MILVHGSDPKISIGFMKPASGQAQPLTGWRCRVRIAFPGEATNWPL